MNLLDIFSHTEVEQLPPYDHIRFGCALCGKVVSIYYLTFNSQDILKKHLEECHRLEYDVMKVRGEI